MKIKIIKINSLELLARIHISLYDFNTDKLDIPSPMFCNYIINQLRDNDFQIEKVRNDKSPYPVLSLFGKVDDIVKISFSNEEDFNRFILEHS